MPLSDVMATGMVNQILNGTAFAGMSDPPFMSLHTDAPDGAGSNEVDVVTGYARLNISAHFPAAGAGVRSLTNTIDLVFVTPTAAFTATYWGVWNGAASFIASGVLEPSIIVEAGQPPLIPAGKFTLGI